MRAKVAEEEIRRRGVKEEEEKEQKSRPVPRWSRSDLERELFKLIHSERFEAKADLQGLLGRPERISSHGGSLGSFESWYYTVKLRDEPFYFSDSVSEMTLVIVVGNYRVRSYSLY